MNRRLHVFVGMSGGVDSSLTAALLVQAGYRVTGVYMKNWSQDLPGMVCPWREDYQDAKRVAVQLGMPFTLYDFQAEYRQKVVDYMVDGYRRGLTPNPDILCNQEVKFKLFLEAAQADGADLIATGHYARVVRGGLPAGDPVLPAETAVAGKPGSTRAALYTAANAAKDQTYFLYRVSEAALARTLMPIGEYASKADVRAQAAKLGLSTAHKKDSQGICFVGKVGIKDFLLHELGPQPAGPIVDQHGVTIGQHDGAIFYTIGQRQGLGVGGGLPYYVTGKNMTAHEVYVTTDLQDPALWHTTLQLTQPHWINDPPTVGQTYLFCTRYRAEPVPGVFTSFTTDHRGSVAHISLGTPVRALTPGQSAVCYEGQRVVGGGIVV